MSKTLHFRSRIATLERAVILSELGVFRTQLGAVLKLDESETPRIKSYREIARRFGSVLEADLKTVRMLARRSRNQGDFKEARVILEVAVWHANARANTPLQLRAETLLDLADVLKHLNEPFEAWRILGITIRLLQRRANDHARLFLTALNNRAEISLSLRKYQDAETKLRELDREFGARADTAEETVLAVRNNLAEALRGQGYVTEALAIHEKVLERRLKLLGERHSDTVVSEWNVIVSLVEADRIEAASEMLERLAWVVGTADEELTLEQRMVRERFLVVRTQGLESLGIAEVAMVSAIIVE